MDMDFLKKLDLTPTTLLKIAGIVLVLVLVFSVFREFLPQSKFGSGIAKNTSVSYPAMMDDAYDMDMVEESVGLSARNIMPEPQDGYTSGGDAEEFEVTDYRATIETRNAEGTCASVKALKDQSDVIFEYASESENGCSYTFKVANDAVAATLSTIDLLKPRELTENTRTIKNVVEDYTSELEILQNKLDTIEATLAEAVAAYDDITAVARNTRDAESLAKIIDSKLQIIERLTQRRIEVASQIERIERSKAEQLDRLNYTYFYVNVYENKYLDGKVIADSWKRAVRGFVSDVNTILQDVTIGFVSLLFFVFQYALYFFLLLFVVKFGWKATKDIWNK